MFCGCFYRIKYQHKMNTNKKKIKNYQIIKKVKQQNNYAFFTFLNDSSFDWVGFKQTFLKKNEKIKVIRLKNYVNSQIIINNQSKLLQSSIFVISGPKQIFPQILKTSLQIKKIECLGAFVNSEWIKPSNCIVFSNLSTNVYNPIFFLFFINFIKVIQIIGTQKNK